MSILIEVPILKLYKGDRQFAPCCDLLGLGDRPNLNSSKRARNLASIRVADICRKIATKRSESKGNSDVAASGVGCSKGAVAIGGRQGSDVHGYCRGGQQRYGARDGYYCVQFVTDCDQDSWQRTIIAGCDVNKLQRKIATGSFLPQGSLLAAIKEDGSKRLLLAVLGSERCVLRLKG
ncbi:hypothetical protein B296_00053930 [Ensete ventricosum]|uniref:Uncharacterized protein n=1 Tax=Ensete ventricosum TaxID=4639 RepID=A0A426WYZ5_ENSVE|nr:hypothetical protein B296_00053930 [Ensete ventricosum]